jgi:hypothetical protein
MRATQFFYKNFLRINISRRVVLRFIFRIFGGLYVGRSAILSYMPDSLQGRTLLRFYTLFPRFVDGQRSNNCGDLQRLSALILNIDHVLGEQQVAGDLAEVGVYKGNTASILADFATEYGRTCWLFDTFEGFHTRDLVGVDQSKATDAFKDTSLYEVRNIIGRHTHANCRFVPGYFPESIPADCVERKFAVVSLDCDLYQPIRDGLMFFSKRMVPGGLLIIHDYAGNYWPGAKQAVDEFCAETGNRLVILPDKSGTACIRIQL